MSTQQQQHNGNERELTQEERIAIYNRGLIAQTKQWRCDLDSVLQSVKAGSDKPSEDNPAVTRASRERSLAITKIQEAIMWLGMDLKAMSEEGIAGCENPYPQSYDPKSPVIAPTADGLKL